MPLPLAIPIGMAAAGMFSKIYGGIKSGKANREAEGIVDNQITDLNSWYDVEKNRDFLESNVARSAITNVLENIEDRNKQVDSTAAVTGGSDASVIAAKAKSQDQYSNTIRDIASYGTARGDRIEDRYRTNLSQLMGQKTNIQTGKAANAGRLSEAGGQLISAAGSMYSPGAGMFGSGAGGGQSLMSSSGNNINLTGNANTASKTMSEILG